jgi:hypothetical protein
VRGGEHVGRDTGQRGTTHFIVDQEAVGHKFGAVAVEVDNVVRVHFIFRHPIGAEAKFLGVEGVARNGEKHFFGAGAFRHRGQVRLPDQALLVVALVVNVGTLGDGQDRNQLVRDVAGRTPTNHIVGQRNVNVKIAALLQGHWSSPSGLLLRASRVGKREVGQIDGGEHARRSARAGLAENIRARGKRAGGGDGPARRGCWSDSRWP